MNKPVLISRAVMLKQMNDPTPFSLKFRTIGGEYNKSDNVVCTSINHKNKTVNLNFQDSSEYRTVRHVLVTEFNGMEVYL